MYGLVKIARIFWQKLTRILLQIGFKACGVDQCLFAKMGKHGIIIVLVYVDDATIMGSRQDIDDTFAAIMEAGLNITTEGKLNDFLGCSILREKGKQECWLLQTHLIKKLENTFGKNYGNC